MRRSGFTLVEVLVAVAITGMVALIARRLVQVTLSSVRILTESRARADQAGNAYAWLRSAMLSLEAGDSWSSFAGNPDRMEFSGWIQQPGGWFERRRMTLALQHHSLVLSGVAARPLVLVDSIQGVGFDYLLDPGANTRFVGQWISPVSAPLGVRIRIDHRGLIDTLFLLIKERG